jgi:WS/DGAT/MGAT family acyltransferase
MSNADAAWLHMDRATNLMVVNALLWFEEPVDGGRVREILRSRLVEPFPRFRQRVIEPRLRIGAPSWEDDPNFDLDRHVHRLAVPAPGDKRALAELVSDLIVRPLDRCKPLWDTYLVDGFGGGTAMLSRIHHCIADGIALSRVLLSLTDSHPTPGSRRRATAAASGVCLARSPRRSRPARTLPRRVFTRASRSSRTPPPSCRRSPRAGLPTRLRSRSSC